MKVEEMAQSLRMLTVFPEHVRVACESSVPNTHIGTVIPPVTPAAVNPTRSYGLHEHPHTHSTHSQRDTYTHK